MHSIETNTLPFRPWRAALIGMAIVATIAIPVRAHEGTPFTCNTAGTPDATVVAGTPASPEPTVRELESAYIVFQEMLSEAAIDFATLASANLEQPEIAVYADAQIAQAEGDLATLAGWEEELFPDASVDPNELLAVIDAVKMELDLPAGQGGVSTVGLVPGIAELCMGEGPFDQVYLAGAIDLAQQQIDLAQVAVVKSVNPEIVEFATGIIERESAAIGQLVTWQNELAATPAG
jgi:uncharacterized protein (DUF305 family)